METALVQIFAFVKADSKVMAAHKVKHFSVPNANVFLIMLKPSFN